MKTCRVENCPKPVRAKKMCQMHYLRVKKHGTTELPKKASRFCEVDGCNKAHYAKGWCKMHHQRVWVNGSLERDQPINHLARHVVLDNGCWEWTGPLFQVHGYGQMGREVHGTNLAHRAYWIEAYGPVPDGAVLDHVCHSEAAARGECAGGACEHRKCVNPVHLETVTPAENARRGMSNGDVRGICANGLHDLTLPGAFYEPPGENGSRACYECSKAKWARQEFKRRKPAPEAVLL